MDELGVPAMKVFIATFTDGSRLQRKSPLRWMNEGKSVLVSLGVLKYERRRNISWGKTISFWEESSWTCWLIDDLDAK